MSISVLIVEDHPIVCEGLQQLLTLQPDMDVVGIAQDGLTAVALAHRLHPDIVLMDINLPGLNGVATARRMRQELTPPPQVIMLTAHHERHLVLDALHAGAAGYLLKQTTLQELLHAIRLVHTGVRYLTPCVAEMLLPDLLTPQTAHQPAANLTPREREVVQLLAAGHSAKEAAALLGLRLTTVESYRKQAMTKLDLHTVADLTRYAIREGLLTP